MLPEKLVRDKIPDIIREDGDTPKVRVACNEELDHLIRLKVVEESQELLASGKDEEIADVLEALEALLAHRSIDWGRIDALRVKKKQDRGGFEKRFVLSMDE